MKKSVYVILFLALSFCVWKFYVEEYLAYKSALDTEYYEEIEHYFYCYPNGKYFDELNDKGDDLLFDQSKRNYETSQTKYVWSRYYEKYPEGKHIDEAKKMEFKVEIKRLKDSFYPFNNYSLSSLNKFIAYFPDSDTMDQIISLKESIWDTLNYKYDLLLKTSKTPQNAVAFFKQFFDFMKKNGKTEIYVHMVSDNIDLLEFNDYSEKVKGILDLFTESANAYNKSQIISYEPYYPLPSKKNPASPKGFYSNFNIQDYEKRFRDGFNSEFEKAFGFSPFIVMEAKDDKHSTDEVYVEVKFNMKNMHEKYRGNLVPVLYNLTTTPNGSMYSNFDGYVFGLTTECDISMSIPDIKERFQYNGSYDPDQHLYGIEISNAYKSISESTFRALAIDFIRHFI